MEYRKYKGRDISLLGLGTMRLPEIENEEGKLKVDSLEAIAMIREAIDAGVNYVDTAYSYHDGESEIVLGQALKEGYREKVLLADKMPIWFAKEKDDLEKIFNKQLERLQVDVIDNYLIHNVTEFFWKKNLEFDTLGFLEEKRREGKIKYIGFSFHDEYPFFKEIIDYYDWDFCQIQLNYMDVDYQAGLKGLKYAASKDIPVVVMEPLKGGKLVDILPESICDYWEKAQIQRTPPEWAFRWVASLPEVITILSGVSSRPQIEDNIRIFKEIESDRKKDIPPLSPDELTLVENVGTEYNRLIQYSCTTCKYCLPCPQKIDIPTILQLRNEWEIYGHSHKSIDDFNMWIAKKRGPSTCIKCGACEEKCPQHLPIMQVMDESAEIFEK